MQIKSKIDHNNYFFSMVNTCLTRAALTSVVKVLLCQFTSFSVEKLGGRF